MLDSRQPTANASKNPRARCSSAYIVIMKERASTPNAVTATVPVDHAVRVPVGLCRLRQMTMAPQSGGSSRRYLSPGRGGPVAARLNQDDRSLGRYWPDRLRGHPGRPPALPPRGIDVLAEEMAARGASLAK